MYWNKARIELKELFALVLILAPISPPGTSRGAVLNLVVICQLHQLQHLLLLQGLQFASVPVEWGREGGEESVRE
jgi:hypothetical protein